MTKQEVFDKIVEITDSVMPEIAEGGLSMDTPINTEGFESMNFILLVCKIEAEYGIKLPDRVWFRMKTIGEVVDAVIAACDKKRR